MKSKLLAFLFLCLSTSSIFSTSMYDGFKGQEWKFMEYMLIKKPKQDCNTVSKKIKHWGLTFLSFELTKIFIGDAYGKGINNPYWHKFADEISPSYDADNETKKKYQKQEAEFFVGAFTVITLGIISSIISYRLYNRWYRYSTEYQACLEFIEGWPKYKNFTPKELHSSFDTLHQKHLEKKLTDNEIYEMVTIAKELVTPKMQFCK